jgi:hypothetical protein
VRHARRPMQACCVCVCGNQPACEARCGACCTPHRWQAPVLLHVCRQRLLVAHRPAPVKGGRHAVQQLNKHQHLQPACGAMCWGRVEGVFFWGRGALRGVAWCSLLCWSALGGVRVLDWLWAGPCGRSKGCDTKRCTRAPERPSLDDAVTARPKPHHAVQVCCRLLVDEWLPRDAAALLRPLRCQHAILQRLQGLCAGVCVCGCACACVCVWVCVHRGQQGEAGACKARRHRRQHEQGLVLSCVQGRAQSHTHLCDGSHQLPHMLLHLILGLL